MKQIPLSQNKVALVDDEDYERVSAFKWYAHCGRGGKWYAVRNLWVNGRRTAIKLHQFIMASPNGEEVDQKNGDGLNCQRENMRTGTHQQNTLNRAVNPKAQSGYKGVRRVGNRWYPYVATNGKQLNGRGFSDPRDAALLRDQLALEHHGEFAWLNFPRESRVARINRLQIEVNALDARFDAIEDAEMESETCPECKGFRGHATPFCSLLKFDRT